MLAVEKTVRREKETFSLLTFFSKESKLVLIRARVHPFPFRTRKLSSLLPKILVWRRTGKIGNANTKRTNRNVRPFFFLSGLSLVEEESLCYNERNLVMVTIQIEMEENSVSCGIKRWEKD